MVSTASAPDTSGVPSAQHAVRLSSLRAGDRGVISQVGVDLETHGGLDHEELERRLLELGFVEGAHIQVLHEGLFGRDPIAVKLDDMRVALRRREAHTVMVRTAAPLEHDAERA